jgi:hypothetical protein
MQPLDTPEVAAKLDVETVDNTKNTGRDDSNTCRANNGVNARRRSRSMASAPPSVETVVVKAKRAASSLWMLLHAQVRPGISSKRHFFVFLKTSYRLTDSFSHPGFCFLTNQKIVELCFGGRQVSAHWLSGSETLTSPSQDMPSRYGL